MTDHFDVAIVGAGPAGSAAALQLRALPAGRSARVALIDGATFPRPKLCGGGITRRTEELLAALDVRVNVPAVDVDEVRFVFADQTQFRRAPRAFRVIRRDEFDASLVAVATARGAELLTGDGVVALADAGNVIRLALRSGRRLTATIVIGADGANSTVRRSLVSNHVHAAPFVALEVLTSGHDPEAAHRATFDFRVKADGVRGYTWDFPSFVGGKPFMNRGICGIGGMRPGLLRDTFRAALATRGIAWERQNLEGAWAPAYDPERAQGAPRVLLAGDAVGIDPWLGEGISSAIGTGVIAGHTVARGLETGVVDFTLHDGAIARSTVGAILRRNLATATQLYGLGHSGSFARTSEQTSHHA